jgi:branched-subunit amino acid ABC-type transport system permease component
VEQIVANIIILASRYALATLGLSLVYRSAGYLDFGQGAMFVIGAYGSFVCASILGLPLPAAIIGGAMLAGLLGGVVDQAIYRPLRRRQRHAFAIMLASLGLLVRRDGQLYCRGLAPAERSVRDSRSSSPAQPTRIGSCGARSPRF